MTGVVVNTPRVVGPSENLAFTNEIGVLVAPISGTPALVFTLQGSIALTATARTVNSFTGRYEATALVVGSSTAPSMRVQVDAGGALSVNASVTAADSPAIAAYASPGLSFVLMNNGTIEARNTGDARAVFQTAAGGSGVTLGNVGVIRATSTGGSAVAVSLEAPSLVNDGRIEAQGVTESIGLKIAVGRTPGSFYNRAEVVAAATGSAESIGVLWNTTDYTSGLFDNAGRIQGDIALKAVTSGVTYQRFNNHGEMVGRVELSANQEEFYNAGRVFGSIDLGSGDDTYNGADGVVSGLVSGGDGRDRLIGGAGFDYLQGNAGADTASGGAGDDWVVGGKDNDSLSGGAGADLVYGNLGADTCEGGDGADVVRGGQQDDVLVGGAGDDYLSGDRDNDTITGGAGADTFHSFGEAGVDRVLDFSAAEGDRVRLDPGTEYALAQVGSDTVINMVGGAQMILVGVQLSALPSGWIFVG